jgi:hypothetical protein
MVQESIDAARNKNRKTRRSGEGFDAAFDAATGKGG